MITQECNLKISRICPCQSEKAFTAFDAFDGVAFKNSLVRVFIHILLKGFIVPSITAGLVYFDLLRLFARLESDSSWHINGSGINLPCIDKCVDGFLTYSELIRRSNENVMDRLTQLETGRKVLVELLELIFSKTHTLT